MRKRFLSAFLALCMVLTLLPVSAMAESPQAQWGVAAADGTKPAEWAGSGTLEAAVTYANELSGDAAYIQLLSDVTAATTMTFTQGTTTLDLYGCKVSGSSLRGVITLSLGTLTIADSSVDKNGTITSVIGNKDIGTINVNGGSLVVDGGTVENLYNSTNGHTISVSSGNVTVNGGKVERTGNYSFAYAINNMGGGTISVNGGIVTGGSYAIYNNDSGTVNVTGGEVSTNGTVILNRGTVRITGGTVENTEKSWTIYNYGSGRVSIDGGEVRGSNPIFMPEYSTGTVNVTGGKVIASNYAIESQGKGSISVTGGELIGNSCAIRCSEYSTANVSVTGGELTSTGFWTIFNYGTGSLSVVDARVEGKSSMYGAIYQRSTGKLTIGGTAVVTSPYQSSTSGTIYMGSGSTLEINGGMVENTNTGTDGLAISVKDNNGRVSIKNSSPVIIKASGKAMTYAPDLSDTIVKTAATNINGIDGVETYNPDNIATYKYLEFVPAVSKIGSASYPTLQAAIDAVENGQTVTLMQDASENITIPGELNRSFTLDLNGKTLNGGADNPAISHNGSGTLTIIDSSGNKEGKVTLTAPSAGSTAISLESGSGSLVIDGSRISVNEGAAIINHTTGVVNVSAGTVESLSGSAIVNRGAGSVNVSGGTLSGSRDGIMSLAAGTVRVSGGIVSGGTGRGVYCSSGNIIIPSGAPIIKSSYMAMNKAPDLTGYTDVKITASTNVDGSFPETYNHANIEKYKYLKFELKPIVVKNTVTGISYHNLQTAVGALTANNQTIQLLDNIDLTDALTIASGNDKSFTIDLNGKTLDGGVDNPAIRHNGSGTLTICDKSNDGDGKITGGYYATIILGGGKLTVDSGTVDNFYDSAYSVITTILNEGTGKITISGTAAVTGLSTTVYLEAGIADTAILEITGGTIESTNGVAISNYGPGKIVISGGSPTIRGAYQAMNLAPDLSSYGDVKVTASTNYDGSSPTHTYFEDDYNFKKYKYLKFEPAPDIARIGSKVFTKLQEAIDAITDNGQTIDLLGDIKLTFPIVIANDNDKSFTINLNGCTVNSNVRSAIRHSGSGTLTITDDSTEGGGVITSIHDTTYSGYTIYLDGGSLVVAGGLVENANDLTQGSAIYNNGTGNVSVVSTGMVKSISGSAIFNVSTGKITISGSAKVTGASRAVSNSGTIYLYTYANTEDVLLEIAGGTIENTDYGYAIYNRADGKIAITSGSPVILGGYMAMNKAPDLSLYANVKVKACKDESGTKRVIYNANDIFYYRYLAFEPGTTVAKNTTTGTEYFTVKAAVDAAADGDTIELTDDIAFVNPLNILLKNNMSLTLDLKGKTYEGSIEYTCESGKLTIDDTVGGGKITAAHSSFSSGTIFARGTSEKTSVLEIKGGTVENSDASGYFGNGGNAIYNQRCTVNVTGGTVTSASGGASILNANAYPFGIVSVSGGTVKSTNINGSGAIYNESIGTVNVSGGTVDGNSRYAIYNNSTGKITISGTAILYGSQAGVYLREGTANTTVLEITGGTVENSTTGDAVRNAGSGIVRISGGVVRATAEGGTAIRNSIGKISISGGTVENTATGKAIDNTGWGYIEVAGGTVHAENGEAIYNEAYGTEILISGGTVSAKAGTAIYNTSGFVHIIGGPAVIRGGTMAMNMEPKELDHSLKIMASTADANGTDALEISRDDIISGTIEEYYENRVQAYKYLRFEPVYSVTYNSGANGTGGEVSENKTHDAAFALRGALFTRAGYTQTGWATTDGGAKAYELGGSYTANEAITLYPVWTLNTYAVTYHPGTNGTGSQATDTKTHGVALTLRGAGFTRAGYTQTGWATTDGGAKAFELSGSYAANTPVTLYPAWTANTYDVSYHPGANGTGSQATDTKTHDVELTLRGAYFTREGYTQTGWATTDGGAKAFELSGSYTANTPVTLYPAWTQNTYAVTLPSGTGYSVTAQNGSSSPVAHGASFSFTVEISEGYLKSPSFAVKANGVQLTENGSGVYTIHNITQAQTVTVEGVQQYIPAPSPTPAPPADTVYNDPSKSDATIWLTGSGFANDDLLMTQALTSGSDYNALLKLSDDNDVVGIYEISLKSGAKSADGAMYLTFDLAKKYAGQAFTLVHKKADGSFEYLHAKANASGIVKFGPLFELSPFMLVKGTLRSGLDDTPKTGDNSSPWLLWLLCGLSAAGITALLAADKRKKSRTKNKASY